MKLLPQKSWKRDSQQPHWAKEEGQTKEGGDAADDGDALLWFRPLQARPARGRHQEVSRG